MKYPIHLNLSSWLTTGTFLFCVSSYAQTTLVLDSCYVWAKANYPLIKQFDLIEKSKTYSLNNASQGKQPQISFTGSATYQSDVTTVPIKLPNQEVPVPPKDQVKLYGEISESINDLFTTDDKDALVYANADVEHQKIEVELYKLKERISQIYFGILLYDAQMEQTVLLKKDIQTGLNKIYPSISNGIAIQSNATMLEAELLKADQKTIELKSGRRAYMDMLSLFIHRPITDDTKLKRPSPPTLVSGNNRPELKLYEYQRNAYGLQSKVLKTDNQPHFSLFLQAGVGKPALNVLSTEYAGYYLGGLRFNWNLSRNNTYHNEIGLIALQQQTVDQQRETFLFNTNLTISQDNNEISKLQQLIVTDYDMVSMRESVANTTKVQLDNGTATANDYIENLNAADQARQNLAIHEIQLLQNQVHYLITSGQ
jgi:outer membrane protein TolC